MKIFSCLLVAFALLFAACTTKFDLTASWKDITIVYGLLNKADDTTFIKINKAFLDPTTSALVIAKIPDSLYYKNITVQLHDNTNNSDITLTRADGNLEGRVKQSQSDLGTPGIFATAPNYLYQTTQKVNSGDSYTLNITNGETGKVVTATTSVIADFPVINPASGTNINFPPSRNLTISWQSAANGKVYDLIGHFFYHEVNTITNNTKDTSISWYLFKGMTSDGTGGGQDMITGIPGQNFYNFINSAVADNPNVYRVADSINFSFYIGGLEYYNYVQVALAQTGLTSSQVEPTYTNVNNGIGLFSSRASKNIYRFGFTNPTIDSLACGNVTRHLNFHNSGGITCR